MKYLHLIILLFFIIGCTNENVHNNISSKMNPASKKCIDDGFSLIEYKENNIVIDHFCVNKKNGKKCKEWDYFNQKCNLK